MNVLVIYSSYGPSIQNCTAAPDDPDRQLECLFPAIPSDLLDDIINGTLELRYSLVAASVPGLDNLHEISRFEFKFIDDPVITPFNGALSYQPGSSMTISIIVSVRMCIMFCSVNYPYIHVSMLCCVTFCLGDKSYCG